MQKQTTKLEVIGGEINLQYAGNTRPITRVVGEVTAWRREG
jgi:hypothetical protein